jgi:hypothetical protein
MYTTKTAALWGVTPYGLVGTSDVSEESAASIFKAEEYKEYIAFIHSQ